MTTRAIPTHDGHIEPTRRLTTRALRDLEPNRPITGGVMTYSNTFGCLPDSVADAPDVRKGTWILDSTTPR